MDWRSFFRHAEEPLSRCGKARSVLRRSLCGVPEEPFRRSGKARLACAGCLLRRENASVCGYYTVFVLSPFLFCGFALSKSSKYIYAFSAMLVHPPRGARSAVRDEKRRMFPLFKSNIVQIRTKLLSLPRDGVTAVVRLMCGSLRGSVRATGRVTASVTDLYDR